MEELKFLPSDQVIEILYIFIVKNKLCMLPIFKDIQEAMNQNFNQEESGPQELVK